MKPTIEPTHIRTTIELISQGSYRKFEGDVIPLPVACDQEEMRLAVYFATGNTWAKLPEPVKLKCQVPTHSTQP